jgi:hypothetical protein
MKRAAVSRFRLSKKQAEFQLADNPDFRIVGERSIRIVCRTLARINTDSFRERWNKSCSTPYGIKYDIRNGFRMLVGFMRSGRF